MTEEISPVVPEEEPASPSAGDAWNDVVARMGDLGEALSRWTKAAVDDPEKTLRLEEVRAGINDIARKADVTLSEATVDLGQQFRQGAERTGQAINDAAEKASAAAAPHVANALAGLAAVLGRAAEKVDGAASRGKAESADDVPEPPAAPEPPKMP
ncbi:MAG: hypothetical protein HGA39_02110 [Coriobacteriia bacterium]|nr:hypothetical protein [Coriobacteriia bacterium]